MRSKWYFKHPVFKQDWTRHNYNKVQPALRSNFFPHQASSSVRPLTPAGRSWPWPSRPFAVRPAARSFTPRTPPVRSTARSRSSRVTRPFPRRVRGTRPWPRPSGWSLWIARSRSGSVKPAFDYFLKFYNYNNQRSLKTTISSSITMFNVKLNMYRLECFLESELPLLE